MMSTTNTLLRSQCVLNCQFKVTCWTGSIAQGQLKKHYLTLLVYCCCSLILNTIIYRIIYGKSYVPWRGLSVPYRTAREERRNLAVCEYKNGIWFAPPLNLHARTKNCISTAFRLLYDCMRVRKALVVPFQKERQSTFSISWKAFVNTSWYTP